MLSQIDRVRLKSSGWKPCGPEDLTHYLEALKIGGYDVSDIVLAFLKEFGGLSFSTWKGRDFTIDPIAAMANRDSQWVRGYNARVNSTLSPIGEADSGHLVLVMSPAGEVWGGFDDTLWKVGMSGEEAIANLMHGTELAAIP